MEQERSIDKLSRILIGIGTFALIAVVCWYFRSVIVYILASFVISLIGQPIVRTLRSVTFRGKAAPAWLLSILTLVIIVLLIVLVATRIIPVISGIVREAAAMDTSFLSNGEFFKDINAWIVQMFPDAGWDFDIVKFALSKLGDVVGGLSGITGFIGSVASFVVSAVVALFSVTFISFFFIKDDTLFGKIIGSLVPDRIEATVGKTIQDIERLLSRYFLGLVVEVLAVMLADFLGLWLIARIGVNYAIGIAFIAGILNVIPYVGPLIGEVLGVTLCVILKYGAGIGLNVDLWIFALIVLAIMLGAQLVDNFIYQPVIYSTSIKANPLEIFIVLLIAGNVGGIVGMFVAIPSYTVLRVIASRFFYHWKPVRRLIPNRESFEG